MKAESILFGGIVLVVAVMLVLRDCNFMGADQVVTKTDTVWKRDTQTVSVYVPPVKEYHYFTQNNTVYKTDSFVEFDPVPVPTPTDTAAIIADYFATRYYADTQHVKYGTVVILDSVSANRIIGRSLKTDFTLPEITRIITRNRSQFYMGFQAGTDRQNLMLGPEFTLKTRSNLMFDLGIMYSTDNKLIFQGGVKTLVRWKR
jgi:hypothetical protein